MRGRHSGQILQLIKIAYRSAEFLLLDTQTSFSFSRKHTLFVGMLWNWVVRYRWDAGVGMFSSIKPYPYWEALVRKADFKNKNTQLNVKNLQTYIVYLKSGWIHEFECLGV